MNQTQYKNELKSFFAGLSRRDSEATKLKKIDALRKKRGIRKHLRVFSIFLFALFSFAQISLAAHSTLIPEDNNSNTRYQALADSFRSGKFEIWQVGDYIQYLIEFLIYIAGGVCVLFVVIGGYQYMIGSISDDKESGKKTITYALGGFTICVLAWGIVNFAQVFLTSGEDYENTLFMVNRDCNCNGTVGKTSWLNPNYLLSQATRASDLPNCPEENCNDDGCYVLPTDGHFGVVTAKAAKEETPNLAKKHYVNYLTYHEWVKSGEPTQENVREFQTAYNKLNCVDRKRVDIKEEKKEAPVEDCINMTNIEIPISCYTGDISATQTENTNVVCADYLSTLQKIANLIGADKSESLQDAIKAIQISLGATEDGSNRADGNYYYSLEAGTKTPLPDTCSKTDSKYGQCTKQALENYFNKNGCEEEEEEEEIDEEYTNAADISDDELLAITKDSEDWADNQTLGEGPQYASLGMTDIPIDSVSADQYAYDKELVACDGDADCVTAVNDKYGREQVGDSSATLTPPERYYSDSWESYDSQVESDRAKACAEAQQALANQAWDSETEYQMLKNKEEINCSALN